MCLSKLSVLAIVFFSNFNDKISIVRVVVKFFSPLGKLADRAIYFTFRSFFLFLNADQLSQDPLDRFSRTLHQMIGICLNMTDLDIFFYSSRDVVMATDFMAKFEWVYAFTRQSGI